MTIVWSCFFFFSFFIFSLISLIKNCFSSFIIWLQWYYSNWKDRLSAWFLNLIYHFSKMNVFILTSKGKHCFIQSYEFINLTYFILFCNICNPLQCLFVLKLKLLYIWPMEAPSHLLLNSLYITYSLWEVFYFLISGTKAFPGTSCTFSILNLESLI